MFRYRIADGRWYTPAEERARARVAVIERNLARVTGTQRRRPRPGRDRQRPADAARDRHRRQPAGERHRALRAARDDAGRARRDARRRRRLLGPHDLARPRVHRPHDDADRGHAEPQPATTSAREIEYVGEADNVASNRTITTTIAVLGFLIVAISMVGLANAITMSVIERTREVGILRTIGARARDVRRIFATESVALALAGWLLGIPLGYLLDRFLVWLVEGGRQRPDPVHVPAREHRARARRHRPARPPDHAPADPARRPLPPGEALRYA